MNVYKTIIVIIASILSMVVQAANPNSDKTNEKVRKTVERLTETFGFEQSQQKLLTDKVRNYIVSVQTIEELQDKGLIISKLKKASKDFRVSLDSILTTDQKFKLAAKREIVKVTISEMNKNKNRLQTVNK